MKFVRLTLADGRPTLVNFATVTNVNHREYGEETEAEWCRSILLFREQLDALDYLPVRETFDHIEALMSSLGLLVQTDGSFEAVAVPPEER